MLTLAAPRASQCDRFIPTRSAMDMDAARYSFAENPAVEAAKPDAILSPSKARLAARAAAPEPPIAPRIRASCLQACALTLRCHAQEAYKKRLAENLLQHDASSKILAFKSKAPAPPEGFESGMRQLYSAAGAGAKPKKAFRHIPQAPERILDAPELLDDYYLNLLDWSSTNVVAIALGPTVYLWNAGSGDIEQLCQTAPDSDDYITSVSWASDGKHIAVGTAHAAVQIWDASRQRAVRTLRGHSARVGALAWNGTQLATGGRDTSVLLHDVRIREHLTNTLQVHTQEVCGLKWSPSGSQLASGGNDNLLHVYDHASLSRSTYLHRLTDHCAAVKALAWCPFQANLLASGGGTADRCIKFWNTHTGALLNSVDTQSQVCALQWNAHERELLSSHGYSQNQLCLWKYPSMVKMAEFTGHSARVLHMATSPDGTTVCSAAADETLRFWRAFGDGAEVAKAKAAAKSATGNSVLRSINIR